MKDRPNPNHSKKILFQRLHNEWYAFFERDGNVYWNNLTRTFDEKPKKENKRKWDISR